MTTTDIGWAVERMREGLSVAREGWNGKGQFLPSGELPVYGEAPPVQTRFAVTLTLDDDKGLRVPIGAQGAAVIYTGGGGFADLGRIGLRSYSWLNWLYPIPF